MRVGWYWLAISLLCMLNASLAKGDGANTIRTLFLIAAWTFIGLWAEAKARRKERDAARGGRDEWDPRP